MKLPRFLSRRVAPVIAESIEAAKTAPNAPERDTVPFPVLMGLGQTTGQRLAIKPTPRNLRYFSRTVYARRAINAIKGPIAMLDWEVAPIKGAKPSRELDRQIAVATACFAKPNHDDSFRSFVESLTEEILLGAGAAEIQIWGDPNRPLWLYPVDGQTIQIYPRWSGDPNEARYAQSFGAGSIVGQREPDILLRNDELIYIRPNPSSATPFGLGPLEVAFNSISRLLGVGEFAGNVASNARPSIMLDLGDSAGVEEIAAFRTYWRNEVEGQGQMPIVGMKTEGAGDKPRGPEVMKLYPEGDSALFLKWQEFLKAEIATAFDLSPMNLGAERDVNRSTAEVSADRDRDHAIKPMANLIAAHLTREALHGKLGFSQLEFRFVGLDPEDEEALSKIYERDYRSNAITPNEYRARIGMPPSTSPWADLCAADVEIAKQAARGGTVIDPDLDPFGARDDGKTEPAPKPQKV